MISRHSSGCLTIALDVIQNNYRLLVEKTAPAQCACVVKADAYGLGLAPVAQALWQAGAREFFVALIEEGVQLRGILPDAAIYILNGFMPDEMSDLVHYNLVPVLNDAVTLQNWRRQSVKLNKKLSAILHVDTGLNRLGFNCDEFVALAAQDTFTIFDLRCVMSHLACSDMPEHPLNEMQRQRFNVAAKTLPGVRRSLAASDGIFCGPQFYFDLVRPGAALYGLNPTPGKANPMHNPVQLDVPVLQLRIVEEDGFAGYAATASVKKGQRIAAVSLGYADGFSRALSNSGQLFYKDVALSILGRVSMDVVIVDMTPLPDDTVQPGDTLQVFGSRQTPDDLAVMQGTIGYEVMTALGRRFERIYTSGSS